MSLLSYESLDMATMVCVFDEVAVMCGWVVIGCQAAISLGGRFSWLTAVVQVAVGVFLLGAGEGGC